MADLKGKNIGIFWGASALYFIDSEQGSPRRVAVLPINEEIMKRAQDNTLSPEGTKTIASIQDTLRKNKITKSLINLSLPSKDIIFRSFVVPWMQSKEIKGVVEFEATKYIPFSLKELAYSYHAMNITVEGARRLRIIFVAIKKETLKKYTKLLEEAALKIKQVEPSPLSLIRALFKKQKLAVTEVVAIIEKRDKSGKIVIVQENTPLFVREFQLAITSNPGLDKTVNTAEFLRLTNEVRISLDYFNRQEKHTSVARIIYICSEDNIKDFAKMLEEDLELPVEAIASSLILESQELKDTHLINAYGASLSSEIDLSVNIDLSKDAPQTVRIASQTFKKSLNIKEIFPTAVLCSLIIFSAIFASRIFVTKQKAKQMALEEQLGPSTNLSIEKLQLANDMLEKKLQAFDEIQFQSNSVFFLKTIPELLPPGTWIQTLDLIFDEIAISPTGERQKVQIKNHLELFGYSWADTKRDQFQLINNLLQTLKDNAEYKTFFTDIKLEDVRSEMAGTHEITSFRIKFQ